MSPQRGPTDLRQKISLNGLQLRIYARFQNQGDVLKYEGTNSTNTIRAKICLEGKGY